MLAAHGCRTVEPMPSFNRTSGVETEELTEMQLDYLYYFKHLAETLNFTQAAKGVHVTQPTLSAAIKRMEQELGLVLFDRHLHGSSKTSLTKSGEALYEYVCLALRYFEMGVTLARESHFDIDPVLRLGTIYSMQGKCWSKALGEFSRVSSIKPEIEVVQAYSRELTKRLVRRELDVVFAGRVNGDDGSPFKELNYVPCWSQPLVLGVHRNNELAERSSISLEDLRGRTVLSYRITSPVYPALERVVRGSGLDLVFNYDDEITMSSLVSSDEGIVALFCNTFLVRAFENVQCLPVDEASDDFHKIYLVSRKETHPKIVQEFIDFSCAYHFPSMLEADT